MSYSELYFNQKRPPILFLGITALISILSLYFFAGGADIVFPTRATTALLLRHEVVNITSTQLGIFWKTTDSEIGWVIYGADPGQLQTSVFDERDTETKKTASNYHYVQIKGLEADKSYYYKIVSTNKVYLSGNKKPYSAKTAQNGTVRSGLAPAYGKIISENGQPLTNAYVIFNFTNQLPLLAVSRTQGEFLVPLTNLVERSTRALVIPNQTDLVKIEVVHDSGTSHISAYLNQIIPFSDPIVAGHDYDLRTQTHVLGTQTKIITPTVSQVVNTLSNAEINIIFPKAAAVIPANKPLFKGTARPGSNIIVRINSQPEFIFRTKANTNGEWKVILTTPLPAKNYLLTVEAQVNGGKKFINTRNFSIAKSGEQVMGEATPAATITPTTLPTPTLFPSLTITPSTPQTGLGVNSLIIFSAALILAGAGLLLVF